MFTPSVQGNSLSHSRGREYTSPGGSHWHVLEGDNETRPVNMSVVWIMRIK